MRPTDLTYRGADGTFTSEATREQLIARLAEYEATGLEPQDVNTLWNAMTIQSTWTVEDAKELQAYKGSGMTPKELDELLEDLRWRATE